MKDIFARFRVPYDVVRNEREQRELFEKFVIDLEKSRHKESAARDYTAAELSKAMVALVRKELRKLAVHF